MLIANVQQLIRSRDLLLSWVGRTIRGRYQQSALGWLWAIIQPAAMASIFSVIFTYFVPIDTGDIPYPVFSYVAVIPWTFLASSLGDMASSIVGNMSLVTKIYFPREALPMAAMLSRLMDLGISAILLIILILIFQVPIFLLGWLFLPLILLIQIALVLGCGLIAAALNVFYRDVGSILPLVIQLWFYASPIIYPVTMVPERLQSIYFLNPMAGILEAYRAVLLHQTMPGNYLLYSGVVSLILLLVGYWLFKRIEYLFADII
jgi:lipopolysaccharide transport system permease protein